MKLRDFVLALILTLCLLVFAYAYQSSLSNARVLTKMSNDLKGIFDAHSGMQIQQPVISADTLSALVEEYVQLRIDNMAQQDYIEGFSEFMESKYDFAGHQARWED